MKRIASIIICVMVLCMTGCEFNIGADSESSYDNSSEVVTTTTTKEVEPVVEPVESKITHKDISKDGFFSLYYEIPTLEMNSNKEYTLITKFKNESKEDFKIGIKDINKPVMITIIKDGELWGYEGNDLDICSTIKAGEEITEEHKINLTNPGKYHIIIFIDFAREIKASEDASKVDKNLDHPNRGNTSIACDELIITVK